MKPQIRDRSRHCSTTEIRNQKLSRLLKGKIPATSRWNPLWLFESRSKVNRAALQHAPVASWTIPATAGSKISEFPMRGMIVSVNPVLAWRQCTKLGARKSENAHGSASRSIPKRNLAAGEKMTINRAPDPYYHRCDSACQEKTEKGND
jgi:hypothetical protein